MGVSRAQGWAPQDDTWRTTGAYLLRGTCCASKAGSTASPSESPRCDHRGTQPRQPSIGSEMNAEEGSCMERSRSAVSFVSQADWTPIRVARTDRARRCRGASGRTVCATPLDRAAAPRPSPPRAPGAFACCSRTSPRTTSTSCRTGASSGLTKSGPTSSASTVTPTSAQERWDRSASFRSKSLPSRRSERTSSTRAS
jgi:hypothetical protein